MAFEMPAGDRTLQLCIAFVVAFCTYSFFTSGAWRLRHIPTAGFSSWPILSIISTIQMARNGDKLLLNYHKLYRKPFKIASLNEWIVVFHNGLDDIMELTKISTSIASSPEVHDRLFHLQHFIGKVVLDHQYTASVIQRLTRDAAANIATMRDEGEVVMNELYTKDCDDWKAYDIEKMSAQISGRVSARMIVGETLSRDPRFLATAGNFVASLFKTAKFINQYIPPVLWPVPRYLMKGTKPSVAAMRELVEPIINESPCWEHGQNNEEKSPTPLDWLITLAKGNKEEYDIDSLTRRILFLTFGSLSTTATQFRIALYNLSIHPEYIQILREEVERVIEEEQWTKSAMDKMVKLESFIQESHRTSPTSRINVPRLLLQDHTFRDGTFLPRGSIIAYYTEIMIKSDKVFDNPNEFDGLRFYKMSRKGERTGLTSLDPRFLLFGVGRQACPGRFFATMTLKILIAYILMNFDVRSVERESEEDGMERPTMFNKVPAQGEIMLRRRKRVE